MNPERLWVSITSSSYNSLLISTDAVCARKPIVLELLHETVLQGVAGAVQPNLRFANILCGL